jgi:hypothetical protein
LDIPLDIPAGEIIAQILPIVKHRMIQKKNAHPPKADGRSIPQK